MPLTSCSGSTISSKGGRGLAHHQIMGIRPQNANSPQRPITPEPPHGKPSFRLGMLQKFHHFFSKDGPLESPVQSPQGISWPDQPPPQSRRDWPTRPVGVGLPRQATFKRQNSERRERLVPVEPCHDERRAVSHSRQASSSLPRPRANSTPPPYSPRRISTPTVAVAARLHDTTQQDDVFPSTTSPQQLPLIPDQGRDDGQRPPRPPSITSSFESYDDETFPNSDNKAQINAELDTRWILNLSMHFRDRSEREKFFVTYAETPNNWRRVTVSCDYRNAEVGSLEMDLKQLQSQRDKSLQVYESIRDSLSAIQFYDTVTNLKLETSDGRLHVHVTEDLNEIIPYPPRSAVAHLLEDGEYQPKEIRESDLTFDSHLSGFVYKVSYQGKTYIKKEIPGPDSVDEFLYEINALHALHESSCVIQLEAIVVDDTRQIVKGLLIAYAERGAIVDLLYDHRGEILLEDRLRWGRDAVVGLSEIHEAGFVQGDFTLSNIVVDGEDNAKIIDINRRGCPVGWEPPEIRTKIASHQRILMYIGVKSDLFQLGMTLWGLAADDDEPERHDPPVTAEELPDEVPLWYKEMVKICLSDKPRDRLSAKELTKRFPADPTVLTQPLSEARPEPGPRTQKRYIDPSQAVERADIERFRNVCQDEDLPYSPQSSRDDYTFTYPRSSEYDRGSDISAFERPRGRQRPTNLEHLSHRERRTLSPDDLPSPAYGDDDEDAQIVEIVPGRRPDYNKIDFEGTPFLIARNTFSDEELRVLEQRSDSGTHHEIAGGTTMENSCLDAEKPIRPSYDSDPSAASSSTPRNSAPVLPQLSEQHLGSIDNSTRSSDVGGLHNSSSDHDHSHRPRLLPPFEYRRESASPQPPPSLTSADSGFYEPLSSGEEDAGHIMDDRVEMFGKSDHEVVPDTSSIDTACAPENEQKAPEEIGTPTAAPAGPPPLMRSDTSIKITAPETPMTLEAATETAPEIAAGTLSGSTAESGSGVAPAEVRAITTADVEVVLDDISAKTSADTTAESIPELDLKVAPAEAVPITTADAEVALDDVAAKTSADATAKSIPKPDSEATPAKSVPTTTEGVEKALDNIAAKISDILVPMSAKEFEDVAISNG